MKMTQPSEQKEALEVIPSIVDRVISWNAARFEQEFNYELEISMLAEELEELYEAKTDTDRLDAVGDICFVAIGTLWKLGLHPKTIESMFYQEDMDLATADLPNLIGWSNQCKGFAVDNLDANVPTAYTGFDMAITSIMMVAIPTLKGLGFQEYFYDIVRIICDSNDTKVVKKTASDTKANIDKGNTFVPPTETLRNLVNKVAVEKLNTNKETKN